MPINRLAALALLVTGLAGCREGPAPRPEVPLYDNLGTLHHPVTASPEAQRYFDQGLRLTYAFNHEEAVRSFREAQRLDSSCTMCAWGEALALGPNINAPMDSAAGVAAHAAIARAERLAATAPEAERAWVAALATRYPAPPPADRASLDSAYAASMRAVADRFPRDPDAQALAAEALMNLSPWHYWTPDGTPRPATPEIVARLEAALAIDSTHPGACHFYIHAVEAKHPERAVPCAERLATLMPGAGHLVHMPAHIYIRVGRWADAIDANQHAVHADDALLRDASIDRRGMYGQGYVPHNHHFLAFAAAMAGRSALALEAARATARAVDPGVAAAFVPVQWQATAPFVTLVTFGRWDDLLAEPLPPPALRHLTAMAYYARGVAFARLDRVVEARAALDTVRAIAGAVPDDDFGKSLRLAGHALEGELALGAGQPAAAAEHFRRAVAIEDGLGYMEPPTWYYPVRQSLGRALLEAGRPAEAERAYREDLARFPRNGWSLTGLALALEAQRRSAEARSVRDEAAAAWAGADVSIAASRY